jgi:hypothetical protein
MNDLSSVLRRYRYSTMGDNLAISQTPSIDTPGLQRELRAVVHRSDRFLWIWTGALILIFLPDCILLFKFVNSASYLAALFAPIGVGFTVVLAQLKKAWHEKFITETFLALLPVAPASSIQNMIDQMLSSLLKPT